MRHSGVDLNVLGSDPGLQLLRIGSGQNVQSIVHPDSADCFWCGKMWSA